VPSAWWGESFVNELTRISKYKIRKGSIAEAQPDSASKNENEKVPHIEEQRPQSEPAPTITKEPEQISQKQ
jgi:hypothetical protein